MDLGITQTPRRVAHLGSFPRTDDAHALFPKAGALGKVIKKFYLVVFIAKVGGQQEPVAKDLMDGEVDKIPVVRLLGILQIECEDFVTAFDGSLIMLQFLRRQSFELRHKNQQPTKSHLVPAVHQQFRHLT